MFNTEGWDISADEGFGNGISTGGSTGCISSEDEGARDAPITGG